MSFKILSDCSTVTPDHHRNFNWIQTVTLSSPLAWEHPQARATNNPRKGSRRRDLSGQLNSNRVSKRRRKLTESSGNIMAPQEQDLNENPTTRRSNRHRKDSAPLSTPQKFAQPIVADFTHIQSHQDNDKTPTASSYSALELNNRTRLAQASYSDPPSPNAPSSPSRTSSSSRGSTLESINRSTSPVKTFQDLYFADRPTTYKGLNGRTLQGAGGGISERYPLLRKISEGIAVIPISLKPLVKESLDEVDWPEDYVYSSSTAVQRDAVEFEKELGIQVWKIHTAAEECDKMRSSENTWNSKVLSPLLDQVVVQPQYKASVGHVDISTARISPVSLGLQHTSGIRMQSNMVDWCVYLKADPRMKSQIRTTLRDLSSETQSINQTMTAGLRVQPIALNIETKRPFCGDDTADLQSAIWTGAGLARIRELLVANNRAETTIPTLSVVQMHGHDVHLLIFEEQKEENVMYGKLRLGGTDTIPGVFQIIKGLSLLVEWANTDYRQWYQNNVLTAN